MGRGPRFWFPLALLGFAQIGMVVVRLLSSRSRAESESANLLLAPVVPDGATVYSQAYFLPWTSSTRWDAACRPGPRG